MKNAMWGQAVQEYAARVRDRQASVDRDDGFMDFHRFRSEQLREMPDWQLALPILSALATGGSADDGAALASAWASLFLASDMMDHIEDREFVPGQGVPSLEVAANLATGLIFDAFQTLAEMKNVRCGCRAARIFSACGLDAVYGQHRDLTQKEAPVEAMLQEYWETTILKSGSVFRAALEAGATAGRPRSSIRPALADYGVALGVMLQLIDDCRDAFSPSDEAMHWQTTLPLLLYLMATGEDQLRYPEVHTRAAWSALLSEAGVMDALSTLLLQWKARAVESLAPLQDGVEKSILEHITATILESIPLVAAEASHEPAA